MSIKCNKMWILKLIFLIVIIGVQSQSASDNNDEVCGRPDKFKCNNGECTKLAYVCNGIKDCKDGSDETNCDYNLCRGPWYLCKDNVTCISGATFLCDNTPDCPHGDDELNCDSQDGHFGFRIEEIKPRNCTKYEFRCLDNICISKDLICDGVKHCMDGTDETPEVCKDITKTCIGGFLCDNKKCLMSHDWLCDGKNDCGDNSDEHHCFQTCEPSFGRFLCNDNDTCLLLDKVCDGNNDCGDKGGDEGESCDKKNACDSLKCDGQCKVLPTGPMCVCKIGYFHNTTANSCQDINECEVFGTCSQGCTNTLGSYKCTCAPLFHMLADQKTCLASGAEPLLVYSTLTSVEAVYINTKHKISIAKGLRQAIGVAHLGDDYYWTDLAEGRETIFKSNGNGSKEALLTAGLETPEDIAIDWLTGNIYFSDNAKSHIAVCTSDAHYCKPIVTEGIDRPRSIVLLSTEGMIFWTDWQSDNPHIGAASMDGTQVKLIVTEDIYWPNGLALDWPNRRLYWLDAKTQNIESVQTNGQNRHVILKDVLKHPYSIAVFENSLYWSDWETKSIQSCDKFTGKNRQTLVRKNSFYDIHIYHDAMQPKQKHACQNNSCSHMCLLSLNNSYSCACPENMILLPDNHNCKDAKKSYSIILGVGSYLVTMQHETFGRHKNIIGEQLDHQVHRLAFNSLNGEFFVADNLKREIYTVNTQFRDVHNLVVDHISHVSSMSFDPLANNLYWADSEKGTIEVFSLNTKSRTIVHHFYDTDRPTAIALIPSKGEMFVALQSKDHAHIDKKLMNGNYQHVHVIEKYLSKAGPFYFAVDQEKETFYWSDAGNNRIESSDFNGESRRIFASSLKRPGVLALVDGALYWTSIESKTLYWKNKESIGGLKKVSIERPPGMVKTPQLIQLTAATPLKISAHPCMTSNGGCSHICVSNGPTVRTCLCPVGWTFTFYKNETCVELSQCDFRCSSSGECLTQSLKCDGKPDCLDKSDEEGCDRNDNAVKTCALDEFKCSDGKQCIPIEQRCDHNNNCNDKSDELNCEGVDHDTHCHHAEFHCTSGKCISLYEICDEIDDCDDKSDESETICGKHNKDLCGSDNFPCASGQCIPKSFECNSEQECKDGSDEHSKCDFDSSCPADHFKCSTGTCIDGKFKCDGNRDCLYGDDELNCKIDEENRPTCDDSNDFQCPSNLTICLDSKARCNGTSECPRGEDEKDCSGCKIMEFECANKKCIRKEWVCDGDDDCLDKSDETNCKSKSPAVFNKYQKDDCSNGMFQCKDGTCLEGHYVCDNKTDCLGGEDESPMCDIACSQGNNPCDHKCIKTPAGSVCACRDGYQLSGDHKTCVDINECSTFKPCSQLCENTVGSFKCSCFSNHFLIDKVSCKSMGSKKVMLFTTFDQIRTLQENPTTLSLLFQSSGGKINDMTVDVRKQQLYFTLQDFAGLFEMNITTKKVTDNYKIGYPDKLAHDWITDNIYFVDKGTDGIPIIKVCNTKLESCAQIVKLKLRDNVRAISVDPVNKYIFYTYWNYFLFSTPASVIIRANMDGTNPIQLVKNVTHVTALACDPLKKILYFTDMTKKNLQKIDYTGENRNILVSMNSAITRPTSISLFENHAYILNMGSPLATRCKLYGDFECHQIDLNVHNAERMIIVQKSEQKWVENSCDDHKCDNVCVLAELGPKCICSNGTFIRNGVCNEKSLSLKPEQSEKQSGGWLWSLIAVLFLAAFIGIAVLVHRKHGFRGKFNVRSQSFSMYFHNPELNREMSTVAKPSAAPSVVTLGPNHHELVNDVKPCSMYNFQSATSLASCGRGTPCQTNYSDNETDEMSNADELCVDPKQRLIN